MLKPVRFHYKYIRKNNYKDLKIPNVDKECGVTELSYSSGGNVK